MSNPFRKYQITFKLRQLSAMLDSARATCAFEPPGFASFVQKHIERASEQYEDAITALKYHNLPQAEYMLTSGLMEAYLAFHIAHAHASASDTSEARAEQPCRRTESEKAIAYLGSTLSELKSAIEYSTMVVSDFAQQQVQRGMDLYDKALEELKQDNQLMARRSAQAGVLQLAFAGELIRSENGLAHSGQCAQGSPLTVSPIRKLNTLVATIIQVYLLSKESGTEIPDVMSFLLKAVGRLNEVMGALSEDNTVYAQALVVQGLNEIEAAQALLVPSIDDKVLDDERETSKLQERFSGTSVELLVADIKTVLARYDNRRSETARIHLDSLLKNYAAARQPLEAPDPSVKRRSLTAALQDADRVREILFTSGGTMSMRRRNHEFH